MTTQCAATRFSAALIALLALAAAACSPGGPDHGQLIVDIPTIPIIDSGEIALSGGALPAGSDLVLSDPTSGASVTLPGGATVSNIGATYDLDADGVPDILVVTLRPAGAFAVASGNATRDGAAVPASAFAKVGGIALLPLTATLGSAATVKVPVSAQATSTTLDVYRWVPNDENAPFDSAADGTWVYLTSASRDGTSAQFTTTSFGQFVIVDPVLAGGGGGGGTTNLPPVANLTATPESGPAPLTVAFDASASTDSDGTITTYEWDFDGNGTFNEAGAEQEAGGAATASFTYDAAFDGQAIEAAVRVKDDDGDSGTATQTIVVGNVAPVITNIDIAPGSPEVGQEVTLTAVATDPGGNDETLEYEWDFSYSGTEAEFEPAAAPTTDNFVTTSFDAAGPHTIAVRVTDEGELSSISSDSVVVVEEGGGGGDNPTVTLSAVPANPDPGQEVIFTATATPVGDATIDSYMYDFGVDAGFVPAPDQENPETAAHTYDTAGTYPVRVQVRDSEGRTGIGTLVLVVGEGGGTTGPTAVLDVSPVGGDAPLNVTLDGSGSTAPGGNIVDYAFDLGDGTFNSNGDDPTLDFTFTEPGTYTLRLQVTDDATSPQTAIDTFVLTVDGAAVETFSIRGYALRFIQPQPGGSSEGINGVLIQLRRASDFSLVDSELTTADDSAFAGFYEFTDVPGGEDYFIVPVDNPPSGEDDWQPEQIDIINLSSNRNGQNFVDRNGF